MSRGDALYQSYKNYPIYYKFFLKKVATFFLNHCIYLVFYTLLCKNVVGQTISTEQRRKKTSMCVLIGLFECLAFSAGSSMLTPTL